MNRAKSKTENPRGLSSLRQPERDEYALTRNSAERGCYWVSPLRRYFNRENPLPDREDQVLLVSRVAGSEMD